MVRIPMRVFNDPEFPFKEDKDVKLSIEGKEIKIKKE